MRSLDLLLHRKLVSRLGFIGCEKKLTGENVTFSKPGFGSTSCSRRTSAGCFHPGSHPLELVRAVRKEQRSGCSTCRVLCHGVLWIQEICVDLKGGWTDNQKRPLWVTKK